MVLVKRTLKIIQYYLRVNDLITPEEYLCHRFHFKFKKPSIANCPEYVPVMVEDCPEAKIPK